MPGTSFPPTDEQQAAIDAFATGGSFVLEAGAGTGKTSTLQFLAEAAPRRRGLYVAFNRAIKQEAARKFPRNITVMTTHGLGMRGTDFQYQHRLKAPKVPLALAASRLGIHSALHVGDRNPIRPNTQASLALRTVRRFCSTGEAAITPDHVPWLDGLDYESYRRTAPLIVELAEKVWADVSDPRGDQFKFEHDHYLKVWALKHPRWGYDFILFDEAQDSNPVVSTMIAEQMQHGTQVVAVGDAAQSIYGWRGAVDAMETFNADLRLRLTQSFRFGEAIAAEANLWLAMLGSDMRLKGLESKRSRVVNSLRRPHAILCRNNASVIGELLAALGAGTSVGLVGGGQALINVAWAATALKAGRPTDHEEFALFKNWAELVEYANSGDDPNLAMLVKIVDEHGPAAIEAAVNRAVDEDLAALVISTAHKAKGREWESVRLASDFAEPKEALGHKTYPAREELMLNYVAVTRAKSELDNGNLSWVYEAIRDAPKPRAKPQRRPTDAGSRVVASPRGADTAAVSAQAAPYVIEARKKDESAYERWTEGADASLLRRYRRGVPQAQLAKEFGRAPGAIEARVLKLLGLKWGVDNVFDRSGIPNRADVDVAVQVPTAGSTDSSDPWSARAPDDYPYPDTTSEVETWDEDEELDTDLDDWEDDDFEEWREEQESIRATFEHLMARDDI